MDFEATVLLIATLAAAYVLMCWWLRGPEDTFLVAQLRWLVWLYARIYHGLRLVGATELTVPEKGPLILAANHRSGVDPLVLALLTKRRVYFLMAREYYDVPFLRRIFKHLECIPVNRDGRDLSATKTSLRFLKEGRILGIFPQGGITQSEETGKNGVALLALRTGTPILPVYIDGSPAYDSVFLALIRPSRTTVHCGEPIYPPKLSSRKPSREELEDLTAQVLDAIRALNPKETAQAGSLKNA